MSLFVDIEKTYGNFHLRVKLETKDGILALLGASGSGKSLTLKCIAGIETPDKGRIVLDGVTLFDKEQGVNLPPRKRNVGYLFQHYALFPNMTVAQNIAAGVREKDPDAVGQMLREMDLEQASHLRPHQISGGQAQRTALARILVNKPAVLLLDEPFSALDSHLRLRLRSHLQETLRHFAGPVVLVSHDREEVYGLSRQVSILDQGRTVQTGDREQVFACPETVAAARITGWENVFPVADEKTPWGQSLPGFAAPYGAIRSWDLRPGQGENAWQFDLLHPQEMPRSVRVFLNTPEPLCWETDRPTWEQVKGSKLWLELPREAIRPLKGEAYEEDTR